MSYSFGVTNHPEVYGDPSLERALLNAFEAAYPEPHEEVQKHAKEAAEEASYLTEGVFGSEGPFNVSVSGHAKTGEDDQAEEYVQLRISRAKVAEEPASDEAEVETPEPAAASA